MPENVVRLVYIHYKVQITQAAQWTTMQYVTNLIMRGKVDYMPILIV